MRLRLHATTILLAIVLLVAPASARQATPELRNDVDCVAPPTVPGTPVSIHSIIAEGTVPADIQATAPRIPIIGDDIPAPSAPTTAEVPPADAVEEETQAEVTRAVYNLFACLEESDYLRFGLLVTRDYRRAAFGTENPYNAVMALEGYPEVDLYAVNSVARHPDGRLGANVDLLFNGTQVYRFRAMFERQDGDMLLDEEIPLPFDNADSVVGIRVAGDGLTVDAGTMRSNGLVAFQVTNQRENDVEISLVRLPPDVRHEDLTDDPALLDLSHYAGGVLVPSGGSASFANTGLAPGDYSLVGQIEDGNGDVAIPPDMIHSIVVD